jgi:hypothetical protein
LIFACALRFDRGSHSNKLRGSSLIIALSDPASSADLLEQEKGKASSATIKLQEEGSYYVQPRQTESTIVGRSNKQERME